MGGWYLPPAGRRTTSIRLNESVESERRLRRISMFTMKSKRARPRLRVYEIFQGFWVGPFVSKALCPIELAQIHAK